MVAALDRLRRALEVSRREQTLGYVRVLSGEPRESSRALAFLTSDEAFEGLLRAQESGELPPEEFQAMGAHFARARLEHGFRRARAAQVAFTGELFEIENHRTSVGAALFDFSRSRVPAQRTQLLRFLDRSFAGLNELTLDARDRADGALHALLTRLALSRHADAGPEGGTRELAEAFLKDSEDLTREALALAMKAEACEGELGGEALWALLGARFYGLFPPEGQARRVALDWEPFGLRRELAAHGRMTYSHPGPGVQAHVLAVNPPRDVRVAPSRLAHSLGAELALVDGVGRAAAYVHASPALPAALRLATVASVARATGALSVLRMAEPRFLRRVRGLARRDSEDVARATVAWALVDARLSAAAVLARPLRGPDAPRLAAELGVRAITLPLSEGLGAWLVLRLSPGGAFRARSQAFGLAWAMREQFDEDWFQNPRAEGPLRGAMARAGDFSVEAFAADLGARSTEGLSKLAELF